MNSRIAVVFGAGKAGCGHLGHVLFESGYKVFFVSRSREKISAINKVQGYMLRIMGKRNFSFKIPGCVAVNVSDQDTISDIIARSDLVFTAVGITNLDDIAHIIGEGIWRRYSLFGSRPINIIACENIPGAGRYLKHQVVSSVPLEQGIVVEKLTGYSAGLTHRVLTGGKIEEGHLHYYADTNSPLVLDKKGILGDLPQLNGVRYAEDFTAKFLCKIYTINCAQAVAAYIGKLHGCKHIHEAARHEQIQPIVLGAMREIRLLLTARYAELSTYIDGAIDSAIKQVCNPYMIDTISRVAREPMRKLAPNERLIGPMRMAEAFGLSYDNLTLAAAAALNYNDFSDAQTIEMQQNIYFGGLDRVLTEECGLLPYSKIAKNIKRCCTQIQAKYPHLADLDLDKLGIKREMEWG